MLFGRPFGKRLEPVGYVGYVMFHCPCLHSFSYSVGCLAVEGFTFIDAFEKGFEGFRVKVFVHFAAVEYQFAVIVRCLFLGTLCRNSLLNEGLFYQFKSVDTHCNMIFGLNIP